MADITCKADITDHSSVEVFALAGGDFLIEWQRLDDTIMVRTAVKMTGAALLATRDAIDNMAAELARRKEESGRG